MVSLIYAESNPKLIELYRVGAVFTINLKNKTLAITSSTTYWNYTIIYVWLNGILNSKTVIGTTNINGVKEIELVYSSCGLLSFSHPYQGCALYLFSTYDASGGNISPIKENPDINSVTLNGNKLIINAKTNFAFCCYVYTYR